MASTASNLDPIAIQADFEGYRTILDARQALRENVIKANRDLTVAAKKHIFAIHRLPGGPLHSTPEAFARLEENLPTLLNLVQVIGSHLPSIEDTIRLQRSFAGGQEEWVEALGLHYYVRERRLITHAEINAMIGVHENGYRLSTKEYGMGMFDVGGELMRIGIFEAGDGRPESVPEIVAFIHALQAGLNSVADRLGSKRDVEKKMSVMRASVMKLEKVNYELAVKRGERPLSELGQDGPDDGGAGRE